MITPLPRKQHLLKLQNPMKRIARMTNFMSSCRVFLLRLLVLKENFLPRAEIQSRIELNQGNLYYPERAEFRDNQQAFFEQLATFLQNESVGTIREIEYIIYSGDRFPSGPEYWQNVSILRSGELVHKLTSMGVREDQLSIGVSPGEEDLLKVSFFIRDDITSRQNLEDADRTGLGEGTVPMPGGNF